MLKEPVGGLMNPQGGYARSSHYMLAKGETISREFERVFDDGLRAGSCMRFVDPQGFAFLVPASNIAYVLVVPDGSK